MVYALGESLLDIIISSMDDVVVRPGGAMLNTSISLGRSNIDASLITELGDDSTSDLIISFLKDNNVSRQYVNLYNENNTSLALAFLDENKKPSYTFIKNYPENRNFATSPNFNKNDILLFGSLYSLDKQIRSQILTMVKNARHRNSLIIYDPNIRHAHHLNDDELLQAIFENIKLSTIIKGSDEDFSNIFGSPDLQYQIAKIRKLNEKALIIITQGADGLVADFNNKQLRLPAIETEIISTIGAGDAFNAGIIYAIIKLNIKSQIDLNNSLEEILTTGLKFSAQVCNSIDNYIDSISVNERKN